MRRRNLVTITGILLVALAGYAASGCGAASDRIRFGAAGLGGMYHAFADTFTDIAKSENEDYKMEVKTTAGSAANLRLLSEDYVQLAIAQADLTNDAYYGTGIFEGKEYQGYSAVAGLYTEACQIVVRDDSDIESIDDLQGKKISIGEEESGTEQNANQILAAYGLTDQLVDKVNLDYTEAASELKDGEIDAFFCTAGIQTTVIGELSKQCGIRLLELDDKGKNKLLNAYDFYTEYEIPAETYAGQTEAVDTVGVKAVLLASNNLSEKTVENLTRTLFANEQELQYSLSADIVLDEADAVEGNSVPFHKGAAKYYESAGVDVTTEKGSK
mgnify:CR=1 FL=1